MHDPRPQMKFTADQSHSQQGEAQGPENKFDFESVYSENIGNETPNAVKQFTHTFVWLFQTYGWAILIGGLLILYIVEKIVKPRWYRWRKRYQEELEMESIDPEKVYRQQETMEATRRRMQEKYNAEAARYKEKQLELEEKKRRERIEDWERHQQGRGYRSKIKRPEDADEQQKFIKPKNKFNKPLRPNDYNPLTGSSSESSYRPTRRGGGGGGG